MRILRENMSGVDVVAWQNFLRGRGFYWGGHFSGRPDGVHFEVARV